eukprot:TRINITY_DN61417_c0_g1_i1.p1 TRINITY_DN61417_c0_g1~~TRINITY_DN61417_c0_g1_i1.p1  ORF type:complete len:466 (+),score=121.45 TRINITY_DN61417_c0_g1_i1:76-1398(+)
MAADPSGGAEQKRRRRRSREDARIACMEREISRLHNLLVQQDQKVEQFEVQVEGLMQELDCLHESRREMEIANERLRLAQSNTEELERTAKRIAQEAEERRDAAQRPPPQSPSAPPPQPPSPAPRRPWHPEGSRREARPLGVAGNEYALIQSAGGEPLAVEHTAHECTVAWQRAEQGLLFREGCSQTVLRRLGYYARQEGDRVLYDDSDRPGWSFSVLSRATADDSSFLRELGRLCTAAGVPHALPRAGQQELRIKVHRDSADALGLKLVHTMVKMVAAGSPADRAGVREGSEIAEVNGKSCTPGAPIPPDFFTGGVVDLLVRTPAPDDRGCVSWTADLLKGLRASCELPRGTGFGMKHRGARVTGVVPGSQAAAAGIREGQQLLRIGDRAVPRAARPDDVTELLSALPPYFSLTVMQEEAPTEQPSDAAPARSAACACM